MPVFINGVEQISSLGGYEEGTWTPGIADDSLDGAGECQAYTTQVGRYTKIGNRVFYNGFIVTTSVGNLVTTEQTRIVGIPFTADATASGHSAGSIGFAANLAVTAPQNVISRISAGQTSIRLELWDNDLGTTRLQISEWSADGQITFAGVYEI